jgi:hypothetical protein
MNEPLKAIWTGMILVEFFGLVSSDYITDVTQSSIFATQHKPFGSP